MRPTVLVIPHLSLILPRTQSVKIRLPRAQYPFFATSKCHSIHRGLSSQTLHLACATVPLQLPTWSMSVSIAQVHLLDLALGVAKSGSTGIHDQEHPAGPSNIILPSQIAEIQIQYARNVDSGIGSLHQIGKVPHAAWLGLDHVAALFDVPGTVAKGAKASSAASPSRIVTALGSGTVFAPGSRLQTTALQAAQAKHWYEQAQTQQKRADNLQLWLDAAIAECLKLQTTVRTQTLTISQIITSGNVDQVTILPLVWFLHGVPGAANVSENWPVDSGLTPLAPNWVHSRVRALQKIHS